MGGSVVTRPSIFSSLSNVVTAELKPGRGNEAREEELTQESLPTTLSIPSAAKVLACEPLCLSFGGLTDI